MLGLMILCSLLTDASGQTHLHVFSRDGDENVNLPCDNNLTVCTSTSWAYNGGSSGTVTLFEKGMKKNDIKRRERLSLGSDCSLNIYKVTTEDHGVYTCRQYEKTDTDTTVYLHVLHVSPSSTQTEIRPGRSFTLSCQLYLYGYPFDSLFPSERIQLVWVNKAGVNLRSDSRYQISSSPHHCISTLTTTLLHEDDNTEWTCQVTKENKLKTSVRYTVTYSDASTPATESTPGIPAVTAALAALLPLIALIALIALCLICRKRAGADNNPAQVISSLTPVTPAPPPADDDDDDAHGRTEDVAYAEVIISTNKFTERHTVQSDDKVTYAAIRGAE
ncbi:uncharacterized protein [Chanodichthys erythropterus]|uniref:uncharacterized protein n=1 Tax=Chanodichthys erythropterus TaxID=933992 RepID=UPI00351DAF15